MRKQMDLNFPKLEKMLIEKGYFNSNKISELNEKNGLIEKATSELDAKSLEIADEEHKKHLKNLIASSRILKKLLKIL